MQIKKKKETKMKEKTKKKKKKTKRRTPEGVFQQGFSLLNHAVHAV